MTETPKQDKPQTPPPAPSKPATAASAGPAVFGDGSTQAQQDQMVKEADEANAAVKKLADAEREARSS